MANVVPVTDLKSAGLGCSNEACLLFRRPAFEALSRFCRRIIANKALGLIDGLPGTGKSITLWYNMQCLAKNEGKRIMWINFDREGLVVQHALVTQNGCETLPDPPVESLNARFQKKEADIIVCDGANHGNYRSCLQELRHWKNVASGNSERVGFITMSNKIKREHAHKLEVLRSLGKRQEYFTQFSWTLQEYMDAFLQQDGKRSPLFLKNASIFEKEWEIQEDDDGAEAARRVKRNTLDKTERKPISCVQEIITRKFFYAGGSARWMLEMTTKEIETNIGMLLDEAYNIKDILTFNLEDAPTVAKAYLYSSAAALHGSREVHYTMVSERATQLVVERVGRSAIPTMYAHATKQRNPAFLGWVTEADYFSRCETNSLKLICNGVSFDVPCPNQPVEFDIATLELLASFQQNVDLKQYLTRLIPSGDGVTVGRPKSWIQDGYDVVRIQKVPSSDNEFDLLFGQVTKSLSHSLKLQYFEELTNFFVAAGYIIRSIEIGFIVPSEQAGSVTVTSSGRLSQHTVYGTISKWNKTKAQDQIVVYGLDMDGMNYPPAEWHCFRR